MRLIKESSDVSKVDKTTYGVNIRNSINSMDLVSQSGVKILSSVDDGHHHDEY